MPKVDFSQFNYYPSLQCSEGEHLGYRNLPDADKASLLPVFELGPLPKATSLQSALKVVSESAGNRPFILDLSKDPLPAPTPPKTDDASKKKKTPAALKEAKERYERDCKIQVAFNASLAKLLDPKNGFAQWRATADALPNAIPTIQYRDVATQGLQILRQASLLSRGGNSIAIRITQKDDLKIVPIVSQILSVIETPERLLIIVDVGYGRQSHSLRAQFAAKIITDIAGEIDLLDQPKLRAVCMSSSFPRTGHDGLLAIDNQDWGIWAEARESFPFMFGDYAAMHRYAPSWFTPFDWHATSVYPLDKSWIAFRDSNSKDRDGWLQGAKEIDAQEKLQNAPNVWGAKIFQQALAGKLAGIDTAKIWYAAKVNLHLHRQIGYSKMKVQNFGDDDN